MSQEVPPSGQRQPDAKATQEPPQQAPKKKGFGFLKNAGGLIKKARSPATRSPATPPPAQAERKQEAEPTEHPVPEKKPGGFLKKGMSAMTIRVPKLKPLNAAAAVGSAIGGLSRSSAAVEDLDENQEPKRRKGLLGGMTGTPVSSLQPANATPGPDPLKVQAENSTKTIELQAPPQLIVPVGKAQSDCTGSNDGPASSSRELVSRSMKKQLKKYSSQKQLVIDKNGRQVEKTLSQSEVQHAIVQQQKDEIKRLQALCDNPEQGTMSPEQLAEITKELNAKKLALGAIEDIFQQFKMGQQSSDEFLDLDDSDDETPLNQDEDIKRQRRDIKRQREFIHRYRSKDMGILPNEIKKSDFRSSLVRGDQDPGLVEDDDDISKKSCTDLIILKHDNKFLEFWSFLNIFSCLTSSYFYAYISAFGVPEVGSALSNIVFTYEAIFFIKMMLEFITEYKPEGDLSAPVRDLQAISMNYLKGRFIYDFIPILPLGELIKFEGGYERLFYLIKIIRIGKGLVIFTTQNIMSVFKNYYLKKVKNIIKNDPARANNMLEDNNNITTLLMIYYAVQITRLVLIILNVSFFLGIFWYITCDLMRDFKAEGLEDKDPAVYNVENFIEYNELQEKTTILRTIIMMYYMFTSLSTVGFGDFHPRGDEERFICAVILLFGVAIFSYFMGILFQILENFKMLNDDLDDGDSLSEFFGLIRHFNDDVPIDGDLKRRIEAHFDYRWANDKNQAIDDEKQCSILHELPEHVQNEIYKSFLFSSFLQKFKDFFTIEKESDPDLYQGTQPEFYSWEDSDYRDFMMEFLQNLEPRLEKAGSILFEELEEINEIFFVSEGQIEIGFELNKQRKFVIRYTNKTVIGGYNCTLDKRSIFVYKCRTDCEGYTIRKEQWQAILEQFEKIRLTIERNVETDYIQNIMTKVLNAKKATIKKLQKRADVQQLLTLVPNTTINEQGNQDQRNINLTLSNRFNISNYEMDSEQEQVEERCLEEEQDEYEKGVNMLESKTSKIIEQIDKFTHQNIELVNRIAEVKRQLELEKKSFLEIEKAKSQPKESPHKTVQFSDIENLEMSPTPESGHMVDGELDPSRRHQSDGRGLRPSSTSSSLRKLKNHPTEPDLRRDGLEADAQNLNDVSFDNSDCFKDTKEPKQDLLKCHSEGYAAYFDAMRRDHESDRWDYQHILQELRDHPIQCQKYNYSIADNIQNHQQYAATITVNEAGDELVISNSKPDTNPEYVFDPEPDEVKKEVELFKQQRQSTDAEGKDTITPGELKKKLAKKRSLKATQDDASSSPSQSYTDHDSDGGKSNPGDGEAVVGTTATSDKVETEQPQDKVDSAFQFHLVASSASTRIADIEGLIYGGISSRFWMFRKHMICLDIARDQKLKDDKGDFKLPKAKVPFYAWECITLLTKDRYVDLVIKEEKSMDLLMRFLAFALNSIDGLKDSAERTLQAATLSEVARQEKALIQSYKTERMTSKQLVLSDHAKHQIREQKKRIVYRKTAFKYIVMRVRCKISYHAFVKKMSISELIISQIYASYLELSESGSIPRIANYSAACLQRFDEELTCEQTSKTGLLTYLMALNKDPVMRERKNKTYEQKELQALGVRSADELPDEQLREQFWKLIAVNTAEEADSPIEAMARGVSIESPTKSKGSKGKSDAGANLDKALGGFDLFDKSKCADVFEDVVVDDIQMYEQMSTRLKYRKKFQYKLLGQRVAKIKLMMAVGGLQDVFFIKCCLKKIDFIKQMFALELEKGTEVFIPDELTCDRFPISFRYYDPIILISNELFSKDSKIYHQMKAEMSAVQEPLKDWLREFTSPDASSLRHKHAVVTDKETQELKLQESLHAMSLQKSRYLVVDGIQEQVNVKDYRSIEDKPINLRFCHVDEVNMKRQKFVNFKHAFYLKQDHLKTQGQRLQTVEMLHRFIQDNIDELYSRRTPAQVEAYQAQQSRAARARMERLAGVAPAQMTAAQRGHLAQDKAQYAEFLLGQCERVVARRRAHLRMSNLNSSLFMCRPGVGFVEKNGYLEERIEATQQYFDYMSDLSHSGADLLQIRKEQYRVQKQIERLKALKKSIDPVEFLAKMHFDNPAEMEQHQIKEKEQND